MAPIRILLLDDHTAVRQAVRSMLEGVEGFSVVADCGDAQEGLAQVERHRPDVCLVDLKMPGMPGLVVIPRILEKSPNTGIVVFTMYNNPVYVWEATQAGASGYVLKSAGKDDLVRAVRAVQAGQGFLQAEVTKPLLRRLAADAKLGAERTNLTLREVQVLELLAEGKSNRAIGKVLSISDETVKSHLKHLYEKLGAADRAHAVAIALRQRFIE